MNNSSSTNNNHLLLLFVVTLFISGCNTNIEKHKSDLQKDYVKNIIGSQCDKAEENYNEMIKIDPTDQYPFLTYNEQAYDEKYEQLMKDVSKGAADAVNKSKEIQSNNTIFSGGKNLNRQYRKAIRPLRDSLNRVDDYLYHDQRPITYQQLKIYVDYCKVGNNQQIAIKDLKKSLDLKLYQEDVYNNRIK